MSEPKTPKLKMKNGAKPKDCKEHKYLECRVCTECAHIGMPLPRKTPLYEIIGHVVGILIVVGLMGWFFQWMIGDVKASQETSARYMTECASTGEPEYICRAMLNGCGKSEVRQ